MQHVIASVARNQITAATTKDDVIAILTKDRVSTRPAVNPIITITSENHVVTALTTNRVVTTQTINHVGTRRTQNHIITRRRHPTRSNVHIHKQTVAHRRRNRSFKSPRILRDTHRANLAPLINNFVLRDNSRHTINRRRTRQQRMRIGRTTIVSQRTQQRIDHPNHITHSRRSRHIARSHIDNDAHHIETLRHKDTIEVGNSENISPRVARNHRCTNSHRGITKHIEAAARVRRHRREQQREVIVIPD